MLVHQIRNTLVQSAISLVFPDIPNKKAPRFFCWCRHSFSLFNNCATPLVDLWFVADYRWYESSGGKDLKLKLDFVMALGDYISFLALKDRSYGEFSSITIAMSGEIVWCPTRSKFQCI